MEAVADPEFPIPEALTPRGDQAIIWLIFPTNPIETRKIEPRGGGDARRCRLNPPLGSSLALHQSDLPEVLIAET